MKKSILGRFSLRSSQVQNKQSEDYNEKLVGYAKRCFGNPEGQFVLKHFIEQTKLDKPVGCLSADEANYLAGQQDIIKELLALQGED
jgi:hypothetical protein